MKKVSSFVGKYMAIIVLVVAALALFVWNMSVDPDIMGKLPSYGSNVRNGSYS